jgi:uncharacterized protein (UPF0218 family)
MRVLPAELREQLKEPIGALVDEQGLLLRVQEGMFLVSVGDQVTDTLLRHGIVPQVCVIDFVLKRQQVSAEMKQRLQGYPGKHVQVVNPAGCISDELWDAVATAVVGSDDDRVCIEVDGEDDLAALVAIYLAPADATIIYGLPNKGVVVVQAHKDHKQRVKEILDRM